MTGKINKQERSPTAEKELTSSHSCGFTACWAQWASSFLKFLQISQRAEHGFHSFHSIAVFVLTFGKWMHLDVRNLKLKSQHTDLNELESAGYFKYGVINFLKDKLFVQHLYVTRIWCCLNAKHSETQTTINVWSVFMGKSLAAIWWKVFPLHSNEMLRLTAIQNRQTEMLIFALHQKHHLHTFVFVAETKRTHHHKLF